MLNFNNILENYPTRLHAFKENILKEYLQYKILNIIYNSKYSNSLTFMGGTAIRIVHQGVRFSEDLDFDNKGLTEKNFKDIAKIIKNELSLDGYNVEMKNIFKGAYHCYIKFPRLLFKQGMSGHQKEKILIQIDAEPQNYNYTPCKFLINHFGLFRYINTVPLKLLLSQKIFACLNRKRAKGRDFFDVVFLAAKTNPEFNYLKEKIQISNKKELMAAFKERISKLNMKSLADDVEPFLFESSQKDRVILFDKWIKREF